MTRVKPIHYRNHSQKISASECKKTDYKKQSANAVLLSSRKKHRLIRRLTLIGTVVTVSLSIGFFSWFWLSGAYKKAWDMQYKWLMDRSVNMGFAIDNIYVKGRVNSSDQEIANALEVYKGQSIWDIDLNLVKERLEAMEWVEYASVERQLPGTLLIRVVEREPIAIWQHAGQLYLLDKNGKVIDKPEDIGRFADLIIIVGEEIPFYVKSLFDLLEQDEHIQKNVSSVIHIGKRRWNIRLHNGIEIKLPEKEPKQALTYLTEMQRQTKILNSDIETIDLRLNDKISIQ